MKDRGFIILSAAIVLSTIIASVVYYLKPGNRYEFCPGTPSSGSGFSRSGGSPSYILDNQSGMIYKFNSAYGYYKEPPYSGEWIKKNVQQQDSDKITENKSKNKIIDDFLAEYDDKYKSKDKKYDLNNLPDLKFDDKPKSKR